MELKNLGQTAGSALIHTDIRLEREHWTMFRNKTLGIAAAATLGLAAMLGSTAAYAVKICDSAVTARSQLTADPGDCFDSVTFAAETLLMGEANTTDANDASDTTTYYNINDELFLGAPSDIGASGADAYVVVITLDGMIFTSTAALTGATFTTIQGGAAGDDMVLFRLTGGALDAATGHLSLEADFAVSAAGGSATLTMTNQTIAGLNVPGVTGSKTHGPGNVIKVAPALDEDAVAMNPTADVAADGFMMFENGRTTAALGTLQVTVKPMHRDNTDGTPVAALEDIMVVGGTPANSTIAFSGDFSFASRVFLHGDGDCGAASTDDHEDATNSDPQEATAETDLRMMEGEGDDAVVTGTTMAVNVEDLEAAPVYVCIMVDPEAEDAMRIPATRAYTAMGDYMGIADAAIGPMPEEQTLGMVERNGTTVRLPYLTTYEQYNQRIIIVNRGAEARYELDFTVEDGVTAGAKEDAATGMLAEDSTTILTVTDVVEFTGKTRGSGTLIVESQPGMIDVATTQVHRETGATDTIVYTAEGE